MKALSKNQIYAILYLKDVNNLELENIASELNISKERLENFMDNDYKLYTKIKPQTSKDLMIRQTMSKKDNTVAIMTREASEMNDGTRPKRLKTSADNPNIYRIK